ncbi:RimK/LysX family protein [Alcanivorax sp.]|uniref:ATP-dependent zinc protease family protein n=1 Tax=Alcanivorax sp. TaxID=1872427 RepID=UPI0032D95753
MRTLLALLLVLPSLTVVADGASGKMIYGLHEKVHIKELGITVPAKLDTGADSASLSARHIRTFERDGVEMVEFDLAIDRDDRGVTREQWNDVELPLSGHVRIKRRAESVVLGDRDYSRRPVVALTICMGKRQEQIEVNLTDRSEFRYPLLIGSGALQELGALVDPSLSVTLGEPDCQDSKDNVVESDDQTMEAAEAL